MNTQLISQLFDGIVCKLREAVDTNQKQSLKDRLEELEELKQSLEFRISNESLLNQELTTNMMNQKKMIEYVQEKLDLYLKISNIIWDFEEYDRMTGKIVTGSEPIEFSVENPNEFEAVNELWNLID